MVADSYITEYIFFSFT